MLLGSSDDTEHFLTTHQNGNSPLELRHTVKVTLPCAIATKKCHCATRRTLASSLDSCNAGICSPFLPCCSSGCWPTTVLLAPSTHQIFFHFYAPPGTFHTPATICGTVPKATPSCPLPLCRLVSALTLPSSTNSIIAARPSLSSPIVPSIRQHKHGLKPSSTLLCAAGMLPRPFGVETRRSLRRQALDLSPEADGSKTNRHPLC